MYLKVEPQHQFSEYRKKNKFHLRLRQKKRQKSGSKCLLYTISSACKPGLDISLRNGGKKLIVLFPLNTSLHSLQISICMIYWFEDGQGNTKQNVVSLIRLH